MDGVDVVVDSSSAWEKPAPVERARSGLRRAMGRVARSHLTHFLLLGGLIFALVPRPPSERDVHLGRAQLAALPTPSARAAPLSRSRRARPMARRPVRR